MRNFDKAWDLFKEIKQVDSSLLTLKSMSIVLAKYTKFRSFDDTLEVFDKMEKEIFVDKVFGVDEFNVLLRAFSTQKQMMEARAVFRKMYSRFSANTQTLNILLLGFKESGNVTAVELFYHEMVRRGFKPNVVTYNIRIDAYCKKGCFGDGLRLKEEMERLNYLPTLETMTTLIHGACVARNVFGARGLFDEISLRRLNPDAGAYNALISSSFRVGDVKSAMGLMDEMDEKSIGHDNVTYHTMFMGLKRWSGNESVYRLYERMVESNFVPKARTVVMLMKFFCENQRADLGLDLWRYMLEKGCCLHGHAVDVLLTGLCCVGKVEAAYECSIQVLERGRPLTEVGFGVMEKFLMQTGKTDELRKLDQMMKRLQNVLPPSRGQAIGLPASTTVK
ncbi:hypothetical protein GIB67_023359 [Kingdonia uniflora]|uniref:Pentatricopeptide repeat-containing protein n=1 Tax=Kingdonia uniflora TaxID=39325 RepID=A0A7J7LIJ2_9MAGN|nr:hypothetical protein GIB67_023359 [Kingdonia uniflora]